MASEATFDCPECGGLGWFAANGCCGRSDWECGGRGCTGPVMVQEQCMSCGGCGQIPFYAHPTDKGEQQS